MSHESLLAMLREVAEAVGSALDGVTDWGPSGLRHSQYAADVVADEAALAVLSRFDVNVLSEESGLDDRGHAITVVVDPLDGSTNASRRIPHFATSLCVVDDHGPVVALVAHQAMSSAWWAVRGAGAWRDGVALTPPPARLWRECIVAVSGRPPDSPGWAQYRAFGASAIDMSLVADGTVDAFVDLSPSAHGVWDYAAATLICREVGLRVEDAQGRELLTLDHAARRTPVVASDSCFAEAMAVRHRLPL